MGTGMDFEFHPEVEGAGNRRQETGYDCAPGCSFHRWMDSSRRFAQDDNLEESRAAREVSRPNTWELFTQLWTGVFWGSVVPECSGVRWFRPPLGIFSAAAPPIPPRWELG